MTYYDTLQQNLAHNPPFGPQQWGAFGSQAAQPYAAWPNMPLMQATGGFGQAAYGQQYGQYGGQPSIGAFGYGWGAQPQGWGQQWGGLQQRQLSQQDVSEGVRQLVPVLPQILAQAQNPHPPIPYAPYRPPPFLPPPP